MKKRSNILLNKVIPPNRMGWENYFSIDSTQNITCTKTGHIHSSNEAITPNNEHSDDRQLFRQGLGERTLSDHSPDRSFLNLI